MTTLQKYCGILMIILYPGLSSKSLAQAQQSKIPTFQVRKPKGKQVKDIDTILPAQAIGQPYVIVEQQPEFPGGESALWKYINGNLNYPVAEKEKGITGKVYMTFLINTNGQVENPKVLKGIRGGENLNREAIRLISEMPRWIPGRMGGQSVPVQYNLPIEFRLK